MQLNFALLWIRVTVFMVFSAAITAGKAGAADPARLTVMTYNVENLFDVFDDPYTSDEGTPVKPRGKIESIAAMIAKVDADVVTFEEVETEGILRAMVHEMLPRRRYRYIAVMPTNSARGGNLGLISRCPIVSLTSHRFVDLPLKGESNTWRFARDLLRVRLAVSGDRILDLYIVHFKSRRTDGLDTASRKWRLAEAKGTRRIIDAAREANRDLDWTLLVGDFNDTPGTVVLRALLDGKPGQPAPLVDLHAHLLSEQRITYLRGRYRSTLDGMLASPALAARVVAGSARIPRDPSVLGGSDHAPVIATFDLRD